MRNNRYVFLLTILCCTLLTACDKYLGVTPKGYTLLSTVGNYDQWLNDAVVLGTFNPPLNKLADNVDDPTIPIPPSAATDLIFAWAPQYSSDLNTAPAFWGSHYACINKYNTVLQGIDAATGGTDQQKQSLKAEALLGRAFEYFYLVNEYGKEYDSATAGADPGVPFVTSNDVTQKVPPRSSIQDIYDHIIADINAALPDLPQDNSKDTYRGSIAAAYSVLARIYFYARDYTDAAKNATLALQNTTTAHMLDYNVLPTGSLLSASRVSQKADVLYGRDNIADESPTLDYFRSYDSHDLRKKAFYSTDNFTARGNTLYLPLLSTLPILSYTNYGTSVPEMKLIIAEVAARTGDLSTALQNLNDIRIDRFPPSAYQPLQSADQDTVFSWVLRERSVELPFNGLRWFDMRRLDAEGKMPAVNRYDAQGNIIATLPPHSTKYTLQIPVQELQFNPDMQQNP